MIRVLRFNAVGALGFFIQLGALALLHGAFGLNLSLATALAVELAVLHNFFWHERWTWRDRSGQGSAAVRLLRFNLSNGLASILVNVLLIEWLAAGLGMPYLAANVICVAAGAALNYAIADRFVFAEFAWKAVFAGVDGR